MKTPYACVVCTDIAKDGDINGAANVQASGGGGGSTSDMPWRDRDEDIAKYLLRCLQAAGRQVRAKYAKPKYKPRRS